jgi:ribonuclease R
MPQRYTERILRVIKRSDYEPLRRRPLSRLLNVQDEHYEIFGESLELLAQQERIHPDYKKGVRLNDMPGKITGIYRANRKGFGFVMPKTAYLQGDLYIPSGQAQDAGDGDTVTAKVLRGGKGGRGGKLSGRVIEIVERSDKQVVGVLKKRGKQWIVEPDGKTGAEPINVDDPGAKNAREGDKVLVEILDYPSMTGRGHAVILERLGKSGTSAAELKAVMRKHNIPEHFPRKVMNDARRVVQQFDPQAELARGGREDIRKKTVITIDPFDARDFDDAISLTKHSGGNWELGVHIADVSHFVTTESDLDVEAHSRATSVYLPNNVVPMLPEQISNGICSLQEDQDRFVKSAYIIFNEKGKVLDTRFANSLMRSEKRLTYEQVDEILDGKKTGLPAKVVRFVKKMNEAAKVLDKRRRKNGMLELDLPNADLIYDDHGHVIDAQPESTTFSHKMIEVFMLEANEAVARLLDGLNVPFLRRIHPEPDGLAIGDAARILKLGGFVIPRDINRKGLQDLLKQVKGTHQSFVVNLAILKSMQRAEYSPAHIGHYALASEHYCHFTSPIRRYPDLMIHRLLQAYLDGHLSDSKGPNRHLDRAESSQPSAGGKRRKSRAATEEDACTIPEFADLVELGAHCSERQRAAESAEDELRTIKILRLLKAKHLGDKVEGIVTSVTNFGLFVQIDKYLIEGLIRAEEAVLHNYTKKSGKKSRRPKSTRVRTKTGKFTDSCPWKIGEDITVLIANVNLPARQLDLTPV